MKKVKNTNKKPVKTYLKWIGNKSKLCSKILKCFPDSYNSYFEPFVGSGAVFLKVISGEGLQPVTGKYFLSDINAYLINCHLVVAHHIEKLKEKFQYFNDRDDKDFYDRQRKLVKNPIQNMGGDVTSAARLIYLNRRAYGGMWRLNRSGEFNVPKSPCQKRDLSSLDLDSCSYYFSCATISYNNYRKITPQKGDFVFVDPPYYPLSETSNFTSYTKKDWKQENHDKLVIFLKQLDQKGVKFLMTNNDCEYIRKCYKNYTIQEVETRRYIDALNYELKDGTKRKKTQREKVLELIITNYVPKKDKVVAEVI